ncbi:sensor histidine kinase [Reinekea forsetii]|uniref:sensor histidine kinase n=1 Tax=Reinekea forsetii TaxID=1336806 RepID=UPI002352CB30|nr:ATP-binding protein [Reinekea forsetii]
MTPFRINLRNSLRLFVLAFFALNILSISAFHYIARATSQVELELDIYRTNIVLKSAVNSSVSLQHSYSPFKLASELTTLGNYLVELNKASVSLKNHDEFHGDFDMRISALEGTQAELTVLLEEGMTVATRLNTLKGQLNIIDGELLTTLVGRYYLAIKDLDSIFSLNEARRRYLKNKNSVKTSDIPQVNYPLIEFDYLVTGKDGYYQTKERMVLNASQIKSKVMNITHNLEEISDSLNDVQLPAKSTANSIKKISIYFYSALLLILFFYSIYWLISKQALLSLWNLLSRVEGNIRSNVPSSMLTTNKNLSLDRVSLSISMLNELYLSNEINWVIVDHLEKVHLAGNILKDEINEHLITLKNQDTIVSVDFDSRDLKILIDDEYLCQYTIQARAQLQSGFSYYLLMDETSEHTSNLRLRHFGQISGQLAHDSINMNSVVIGCLKALRTSKTLTNKSDTNLIDRALFAGERSLNLADRLLAFGGEKKHNIDLLDVNETVSGMFDLLEFSLGEDIQLNAKLYHQPLLVRADAELLESCVLNLCLNGKHAYKEAAGTISLTVDVDRKGRVSLTVTDEGCGIKPENLDKVFEPFYTTNKSSGGSGLGLSMVYGFMKQCGGKVKIFSEQGQGTSVVLQFP